MSDMANKKLRIERYKDKKRKKNLKRGRKIIYAEEEEMSKKERKEKDNEFIQFFKQEVEPILRKYVPLNNRELWYYQFYLLPDEDITAEEYVESLFFLLNEPKLSFDFKSLVLQIAYIVVFKYLKSKA